MHYLHQFTSKMAKLENSIDSLFDVTFNFRFDIYSENTLPLACASMVFKRITFTFHSSLQIILCKGKKIVTAFIN